MKPLTLGTAGHIDHGKTVLVRALTGVDTDRLPEEQKRGISIELGYAPLELPSGRRLSVVDVPGHERFVRTMVAGATGIDLFLMVVAADDGVMPQTREHAAVLRALGVETGVVAVTKADLADPARAAAEAAELLPGADVVPVAARAGEGIEALRAALERAAERAGGGERGGPLRLHVDRSFTIRGAGTVVTGTLWSGTAARGDEVLILPSGTPARVRSVQVHDEPRERAEAGQRVALNLAGVARDEVARGDVIVAGRGSARGHLPRRRRARLGDARQPPGRRDARRRPPRHARDRRPDGGARRPLLPAAPGAAARPGARRPPRDPLARAPRHARRRRRARPRPAPPRARAATCWPASRAWSAASRSPSPEPAAPPARRAGRSRAAHPRRAGRSRSACARPATSRRPTRSSRPTSSPRCAPTTASPASAAACTSTATRSPTSRAASPR